MSNKNTIRKTTLIGVMAALVFAASWIQIPVVADSRLHLGNVMCLLSGFVLGPVSGGLAAGIGSAFFDVTNPVHISSAPFTFAFKFLMAFVAGKIARSGGAKGINLKKNILAGICGIVLYIILYLSRNIIKDIFFLNLEYQTVLINNLQRGLMSLINGIIAVVASTLLATPVNHALKNSVSS